MIAVILAAIEDDDKAFMWSLYQDYYELMEDTFVNLIERIPLLRTFDSCKTAA